MVEMTDDFDMLRRINKNELYKTNRQDDIFSTKTYAHVCLKNISSRFWSRMSDYNNIVNNDWNDKLSWCAALN